MTHIAIPMPLAQAIADYLASRPYGEVVALIDELRKCQPVTLVDDHGDGQPKPDAAE